MSSSASTFLAPWFLAAATHISSGFCVSNRDATIREVVEKSGIAPGAVAAIAFDGQMSGAIGIDREWNALTAWYPSALDNRYQPYVAQMQEQVGERLRDMIPPTGLGAGFQDMAEFFNDGREVRPARWLASQPEGIAPSLPYVGTSLMPGNLLRQARLVPVGGENGSVYRMEIVRSGTTLDVLTENGGIFYLDLNRMMEAP